MEKNERTWYGRRQVRLAAAPLRVLRTPGSVLPRAVFLATTAPSTSPLRELNTASKEQATEASGCVFEDSVVRVRPISPTLTADQ